MNIQLENLKDQTALLRVTVEASDYVEKVETALRNYRRQANIPGYRPGKAPMKLIDKMYRKQTVAEETYRTATNAAFEYIQEQKIETLGDLMPADEQKPLDFDSGADLEFVFHIGLAPKLNIELSKKDTIEQYKVLPNEDMYKSYRENFMRRFGRMEDAEKVEDDETLTVDLSNDEMVIENTNIGLITMEKEDRKPFIGKKVGDKMEININEIFKDPRHRASILNAEESQLSEINPIFTIEIKEIRAFRLPELNEEFFKMAYPDGTVTNEKEFEADIKVNVEKEIESETEFKVVEQVRNYLTEKYPLEMPDAFLRNWLFELNEGKLSKEDIDKEFPQFMEMMRWDLIKREIARANDIKVEEVDALTEAKALAQMQFRYYGMNQVADEMLQSFAERMLGNQEEARKIYDRVGERKVVSWVNEQVTTKVKEVSLEEFSAMMMEQSGIAPAETPEKKAAPKKKAEPKEDTEAPAQEEKAPAKKAAPKKKSEPKEEKAPAKKAAPKKKSEPKEEK